MAALSLAVEATTTVCSMAPACSSVCASWAMVEAFCPMEQYTHMTPLPFWFNIAERAMLVLPVCRSPMMSSLWPRPMGIMLSMASSPVSSGVSTGARCMMVGAGPSMGR